MAEGEEEEASWEAEALELAKTLPQKEAARKIAAKFHMGRRDVYQRPFSGGVGARRKDTAPCENLAESERADKIGFEVAQSQGS